MKALNNPPKAVGAVASMLLIFKPIDGIDGDGWNAARIMMANPMKLIDALKNYGNKISKVSRNQIEKIKNIAKDPENKIDDIKTVS